MRITLSACVIEIPAYADGTRPSLSEISITAIGEKYSGRASLLSDVDHKFESSNFANMLRGFADDIDDKFEQ